MATASPGAVKQRELVFSADPPGQAGRALELLSGVDDLQVEYGQHPNSVMVTYSLFDYALEDLEQALAREGFRLVDSPLAQLGRKLTYYLEEVEFHNLNVPDWRAQHPRSEIFVKAYQHHLHGDHDDTPPELREYK